jgi:hypothetical protein
MMVLSESDEKDDDVDDEGYIYTTIPYVCPRVQGPHVVPSTFCERLRCLIGDEGLRLGKFSYHGSCLI